MGNRECVLVAGGAGFIGSHVCKRLAGAGFQPVVYDNLSRGYKSSVKWGPLEIGDIADRVRVREVLNQYHPIAVMHFSAFINVGESVNNPLLYYSNNAGSTAIFLQSIVEHGILPFIFSSTAAVYGLPDAIPIDEDHPHRPINAYGSSKLHVEHMLGDANKAHGLPWVALRYFNAAGSDPDGEIGEKHEPETHLIPLVLRAALTGTPVSIFGDDYDTPDGTCVRDYIHVNDLADAHILALKYLLGGGKSCGMNLANSQGFSVREVIATAERVCGHPIAVKVAPRRPGDPPFLIGKAERAKTLLGWAPTRSDLEMQVRDAWNWLKTHRRATVSQNIDQ